MVIWIIGLAGSGKTTLAKELQNSLSSKGMQTIHIDGDDMREVWGEDLSYDLQGREKNSRRIQKISSIFEQQNNVVIVSIMSIFQEHRKENRKKFKEYFEIFLDMDLEILMKRRNIYQDAIAGKIKNVVGVDIEYNKPTTYDLKFDKSFNLQSMKDIIMSELKL